MQNGARLLMGCGGLLLLGGCATPFAQNIGYDPKEYNAQGSIVLSDGRLYGRELLANERREDLAWLKALVDGSKDKVFASEIAREVEQITSFAAALGLKFDPAAGLNYRRDNEVGDIQQQITVERLQIELDQLRRDTELMRQRLAEQTAPVNSNLGALGNANVADATNAVSVSAADRLTAAIDRLLPALVGRLDKAESPQARKPTDVGISPYDEFRDRMALRDLLKSARNAASLDELHDSDGAALYRINFLATVIPDPRYIRSLGVVELQPVPAESTSDWKEKFLRNWIRHLNTATRYRSSDGQILEDAQTRSLEGAGLIRQWAVEVEEGSGDCRGIVPNMQITANPGCGIISLYFPVVTDNDDQPLDIAGLFKQFGVVPSSNPLRPFADARGIVSAKRQLGSEELKVWAKHFCLNTTDDAKTTASTVSTAIGYAQALQRNQKLIREVHEVIKDAGYAANRLSANKDHLRDGTEFLAQLEQALSGVDECTARNFYRAKSPIETRFWTGLERRIDAVQKDIRVYDVGPREQAQQVSTVARAANSLALAASIAGSDPSSGAAAEAAANYSKQAAGRAQAFERIPMVVGYAGIKKGEATGGQPYFGWVFGPKAQIDVKKNKIQTAHVLKAHDVSVDLVAPRWWPGITFMVKSIWGPSATLLAGGALSATSTSTIRVSLPKSAGDFDAFTDFLDGERRFTSSDLTVNGMVSGCETTYLTITGGRGVWRTSQALVMGRLIEGGDVNLLPSMDGVLVKVSPIPLAKDSLVKREIEILSPNGVRRSTVVYQPVPDSGECTPKKPVAATATDDAKAPKFLAFSPDWLEFPIPSDFSITVTGTNLGSVDSVALHGQPGTLKASADGKTLIVGFTAAGTKGVPAPGVVKLEFRKAGATIHATSVRTQRSAGD
jgi:hypothetical protein